MLLITPGEEVLIFQTDSAMCGSSPRSINDYLEWDWIGAWHGADLAWVTHNPPPKGRSYNGGFGLRRKAKVLQLIRHCSSRIKSEKYQQKFHHEDIWYEMCYHELLRDKMIVLNLPPEEVAHSFSVQNYYYPDKKHLPLAVHKPWRYLDGTTLNDLIRYCPEICSIFPSQKPNIRSMCSWLHQGVTET